MSHNDAAESSRPKPFCCYCWQAEHVRPDIIDGSTLPHSDIGFSSSWRWRHASSKARWLITLMKGIRLFPVRAVWDVIASQVKTYVAKTTFKNGQLHIQTCMSPKT